MRNFKDIILEKLKVAKNSVSDIDSDSKELQDLAKLWTIWSKQQKSKYPEISLKGIYRSNKIEPPTSEKNNTHSPYPLTKLQIMLLSNSSCKVFLIFERTSVLRVTESYTNYNELIERLGNGNYKNGEKIYQSFLDYLRNNSRNNLTWDIPNLSV